MRALRRGRRPGTERHAARPNRRPEIPHHRFFPILVAVLAVFTLPPPRADAQAPFRAVYFDDFEPFSFVGDDGRVDGILVAVLDEALGRLDVEVEHRGYPWARAQDLVREGRADAFATVPTPERESYTRIGTEPLVVATFTLFARQGTPQVEALREVETVADLAPFQLGQYLGSGWAQQNLADMKVEWLPTLHQTLRMLAGGRVEAVVGVSQVIRSTVRRLELEERIVEIPNVVDSHPFMLCVGKESPWAGLVEKVDATIREMRDDGTLDDIYARFDAAAPPSAAPPSP